MLVEGPYGRLSARARTRPKVALIGAGVGITPLRALAEDLDYAPGRRRPAAPLHRAGPLFAGELAVLGRRAGPAGRLAARPPPRARTPGSATASARVDDLTALTYWVPDIAERDVYVCGPDGWAEDVRADLRGRRRPRRPFHVESFGW